jgi:quercetin dioxygenase-like cupin family protein
MTRYRAAAGATALLALVLIGANVLPSAAKQAPPPIATEFLSGRAVFTDDVDAKFRIKHRHDVTTVKVRDPSRTLVARFTVQPGAQFPWHSHPGPVIVNVTQGELVYVGADCRRRAYPAGTAFVDPGHGHVHSAFNRTGQPPTIFVATFYEAPAEGPLLIPAEAPRGCTVQP